jgi:hypothetical protein
VHAAGVETSQAVRDVETLQRPVPIHDRVVVSARAPRAVPRFVGRYGRLRRPVSRGPDAAAAREACEGIAIRIG